MEARTPTVTLPLPVGDRLGDEDMNCPEEEWLQWTPWTPLDDLAFADDLADDLSHTQQQIQEKTTIITTHSARLGLTRHKGKSKILNVNDNNTTPIRLEGEALEEVETYLSV